MTSVLHVSSRWIFPSLSLAGLQGTSEYVAVPPFALSKLGGQQEQGTPAGAQGRRSPVALGEAVANWQQPGHLLLAALVQKSRKAFHSSRHESLASQPSKP